MDQDYCVLVQGRLQRHEFCMSSPRPKSRQPRLPTDFSKNVDATSTQVAGFFSVALMRKPRSLVGFNKRRRPQRPRGSRRLASAQFWSGEDIDTWHLL